MASKTMMEILRKIFPDEQNLKHLVFVYGTLKQGQPNHPVMLNISNGRSRFVCTGKTIEKWPMVIASQFNIPYLINKPNIGHQIHGEIYAVDEKMLEFLDVFEGHPTYYTRRETDVHTCQHGQLMPWIYFLNRYRPEMLSLPMYSDYDTNGEHGLPYVERCDRQGPNANCGHTEKSEVIFDS